jgi:hypothetical protein
MASMVLASLAPIAPLWPLILDLKVQWRYWGRSKKTIGSMEEMEYEPVLRMNGKILTLPDELLAYVGGFLVGRDLLSYTMVREAVQTYMRLAYLLCRHQRDSTISLAIQPPFGNMPSLQAC